MNLWWLSNAPTSVHKMLIAPSSPQLRSLKMTPGIATCLILWGGQDIKWSLLPGVENRWLVEVLNEYIA